ELSEPAQAPLLRDVLGQRAAGGVYLTTVTSSDRKRLCEAMGFETVPSAHALLGPELEAQGYVLDLREVGVEGWLEGLIQGRPPALVVSMEDVARAVQAALVPGPEHAARAASPPAVLAQ